jgi:ATP-binding cassette subfamily B protein
MKDFKRLLSYLAPYKGRFLVSVLLIFLGIAIGDFLVPLLFGWTIDRGLASGSMRLVILYAGLLVLGQAVRSVVSYLQWVFQHRVGQDVVRDVRDRLYERLQVLPTSFYRQMPTGEIMSRVTSDVEAVQEYVGWGLLLQLAGIFSFVGVSVILMLLDWQLTILLYAPLAVLAVVIYLYDRKIGPLWEQERKQMGKLTDVLQEALSGVRVVKAFAQEVRESRRFRSQNALNKDRNLARARAEAQALPAMDMLIGLAFVLLAWFGVQRVIAGATSLGTFFSFQWYIWALIWPVRFMGWLISLQRQAMAAVPRLYEILDAPLTITDAPDARTLTNVRGEVSFCNVRFAFDDEPDRAVLDGLNLTVRPGEVVAILGGTGSGKSSLVNLIPRFFDVTDGAVLVDGRDVRELRLASLRRHIGVVPQETFLFSATVRENIAYGRPEATLEAVEQAARLAQAHAFIMEMEAGYDTKIGERGIRPSGGQKQRLALARAILMDPAILILDEATSAVDTETEHEIQRALEQVMQGRTSLIIAQRLSTIKHAHRIVVLKDGAVAEAGTHQSLIALGGEYARIYNLQYRVQDDLTLELLRA